MPTGRLAGHLPLLTVVLAVLVANGPYLFGPFDPSPNVAFSGLATHIRSGMLPGYPTIDPNVGFQVVAVGHRAVTDWLHGSIPWWNPYEGVGMPLAGNMQSGAFFPPVLALTGSAGILWYHMILEAASGLATVALLRRLGLGCWAATAGGCAFALNGTFAWLAIAPDNVIAFLPLTLLGVEMLRESSSSAGRARGAVVAALGVALSVYAGFPETAYIDGLLVGAWWLARCAGLTRATLARFARRSAASAAAGGLLSAPLLVAFADDLRGADVGGHAGGMSTFHLPAAGAVQMAFPYFAGSIKTLDSYDHSSGHLLDAVWNNVGGYLDTTVLILALVGLAGRSHRALRLVLGAWSLVVVLRIYGFGPAIHLVGLVPGVGSTAFYRYSPVTVEFAVVVLAALGIDDLGHLDLRRRLAVTGTSVIAAAGLLAALAGAGMALERHLTGSATAGLWRDWSLIWGVGMVLLVVAAAVALPMPARVAVVSALMVADALALFAVPEFSAVRGGTVDTAPVAWLSRHLGLQRVYSLDGLLQPNYGSYYGVAQIDTNDLPLPGRWADYISGQLSVGSDPVNFTGSLPATARPTVVDQLESDLAAYREIGVAYVLGPRALQLPAPFRPVWSDAQAAIWALPGAAPFFAAPNGGCTIRSQGYDRAEVRCAHPATLIRRELDEPGWRATVGGRTVTVEASGPLFQQVAVPAGTSTVVWSFEPPHVRLSLLGPFAGVVLLLFLAGPEAVRQRVGGRLALNLGRAAQPPDRHRRRRSPLHRRSARPEPSQAPRSEASTDRPSESPDA